MSNVQLRDLVMRPNLYTVQASTGLPMSRHILYRRVLPGPCFKNHRSRRLIGRTMFFTREKWSFGKPRHPWRENWQATFLFSRCRKGLWTPVRSTVLSEQENKAALQKTQRDVKLLQTFLGTRNELRNLYMLDNPLDPASEDQTLGPLMYHMMFMLREKHSCCNRHACVSVSLSLLFV